MDCILHGNCMSAFFAVYRDTFLYPRRSFETLLTEARQVRYAVTSVAIMATLYTFVYIFLILGGGQPFKPWLDIPLDVYYRYNVFFCAPSMFLGWILAAGVTHLFGRWASGTGTFEQILCLFGFGIGVASWSTGFHDLLTSFLGATGVISQPGYEVALNSPTLWRTLLWIQMFLYLIWFILLFSLAARMVYHLPVWASALLGLAGFVMYQGFFLIFNR